MPKGEERLSLREAADTLGVSEVTARRWVKSGKLKAYQPGRKYLIPNSAVDDLLESDSGKALAPSPEWASAASDEEYASWIEAASAPELHEVWISLSKIAEGMEIGPELRRYADRVQQAADQFIKLGGGIKSWKVRE